MRLTPEEQQLVTAPISRKDAVLRLLRNAIIDGRLPAGARLDQNELAATLGVSRMPVREALKQLETEKLVVVFPYRGVEVARLDPATIVEMFEIRIVLEKLAVGRAVESLTKADLKAMRHTLEAMEDHLSAPVESASFMALNHQFHTTINAAGGWPHLVETIDQYRGNVERYVRYYLSAGGLARSQQEHWELLAACESRNAADAQEVIERHLRNTATALIDAIRLSDSLPAQDGESQRA